MLTGVQTCFLPLVSFGTLGPLLITDRVLNFPIEVTPSTNGQQTQRCLLFLFNKVDIFLFRYCGIPDPSWMELRNFVHFFNQNLLDCERSVFTSVYLRADFPGFRTFVVTFLLEMARV